MSRYITLFLLIVLSTADVVHAQLTEQQKRSNLYFNCSIQQYSESPRNAKNWGMLAKLAGYLWMDEAGDVVKFDWEDCDEKTKISIFHYGREFRVVEDHIRIYSLDASGTGFLSGRWGGSLSPVEGIRATADQFIIENPYYIFRYRLDGDRLVHTWESKQGQNGKPVLHEWNKYERSFPSLAEAAQKAYRLEENYPSLRQKLNAEQLLSQSSGNQSGIFWSYSKRAPAVGFMVHIAENVVTWTLFDSNSDPISITEYRVSPGLVSVPQSSNFTLPWRRKNDPQILGPMEISENGVLSVKLKSGVIRYDMRNGVGVGSTSKSKAMSKEAEAKAKVRYHVSIPRDHDDGPLSSVEMLSGRLWLLPNGKYEYWGWVDSDSFGMSLFAANGKRLGYCRINLVSFATAQSLLCEGERFKAGPLTVRLDNIKPNSFTRDGVMWQRFRPLGRRLLFHSIDGQSIVQADWPGLARGNMAERIKKDLEIQAYNKRIRREQERRAEEANIAAFRQMLAIQSANPDPLFRPAGAALYAPSAQDPSLPTPEGIAKARALLELELMEKEDARKRDTSATQLIYVCFGDRVVFYTENSIRKRHLTRFISKTGWIRVSQSVMGGDGLLSAVQVRERLEEQYRAYMPASPDQPNFVSCNYDRNDRLMEERIQSYWQGFGMDNNSGERRNIEYVDWKPWL